MHRPCPQPVEALRRDRSAGEVESPFAIDAAPRLPVAEGGPQEIGANALLQRFFADTLELADRDRKLLRLPPGGVDQLGLERQRHVALGVVVTEHVTTLAEGLDRLLVTVAAQERATELDRDSRAAGGLFDQFERLRQVLDRLVVPEQALREPERPQDLAALRGRRRLTERTPQEGHGDLARAALQRALRRLHERLDDERVAVRDRLFQVHGDLLRLRAGLGQDLRRSAMRGDAFRRRHVVVDGGTHDRVRERGRQLEMQQVGARERRRRVACELTVDPGELGSVSQLRPVAEHGDRTREHSRLRRETREPQRHRTRHRLRPDLLDAARIRGSRCEPLALDRVQERPHEQRVAAGRSPARVDEFLVRLTIEALARDARHRLDPERHRPDDGDARIAGDLLDHRRGTALLRRASRRDDQQRQSLETPLQMDEPAE